MKTERCLLKVFIEVAEQTVRRLLGIRPELRRVEVKSIVLKSIITKKCTSRALNLHE